MESIDKVRREVMQTNVAVLPADVSIAELARSLGEETRREPSASIRWSPQTAP